MENVPSPQRQRRAESSELEYLDLPFQPRPAALPLPLSASQRIRSPDKRTPQKGLRSPTKTVTQHSSPVRRAAPPGRRGRINSDELLQSFLAVDQEIKFRSQSSNNDRSARGTATLDRNRLSVQTGAVSDRGGSPMRNRNRLQLPSSDYESEGEPSRLSDRPPRPSTTSLAPTTVTSARPSLSTTAQSPTVYNKSSSTPPSSPKKRRRPLSSRGANRKETEKEKRVAKARKTEESKPLRTDQLMSYLPRRNTKVAVRRDGDSEEEEDSSVEQSDQFDESLAIRRVARKAKARKKATYSRASKRARKASPETSSPNSEKLRGVQQRLKEYEELAAMSFEEEIVAA